MATKSNKTKLYVVVSLENSRTQACTTIEQVKSAITEMWNELDRLDDSDITKPTLEEFRHGLLIVDANKLIHIKSIESVKSVEVNFG